MKFYFLFVLILTSVLQGCATPSVYKTPPSTKGISMDAAVEKWFYQMGSTDGEHALVSIPTAQLIVSASDQYIGKQFLQSLGSLCGAYGGTLDDGYILHKGQKLNADQICTRNGIVLAAVATNKHPPNLNSLNTKYGLSVTRIPILEKTTFRSEQNDRQEEDRKYSAQQKTKYNQILAESKRTAKSYAGCQFTNDALRSIDIDIRAGRHVSRAYPVIFDPFLAATVGSDLYDLMKIMEKTGYTMGGLTPDETPMAYIAAARRSGCKTQ